MARYAVVGLDGNVVNIVEWDGTTKWNPGEGLTAVLDKSNSIEIGGVYKSGKYTPPFRPEPPPPPPPSFTPSQIIVGLKAIDPKIAAAVIAATDEVTYAEFITAHTILADDARLLAALKAVGVTIDQLKEALK